MAIEIPNPILIFRNSSEQGKVKIFSIFYLIEGLDIILINFYIEIVITGFLGPISLDRIGILIDRIKIVLEGISIVLFSV